MCVGACVCVHCIHAYLSMLATYTHTLCVCFTVEDNNCAGLQERQLFHLSVWWLFSIDGLLPGKSEQRQLNNAHTHRRLCEFTCYEFWTVQLFDREFYYFHKVVSTLFRTRYQVAGTLGQRNSQSKI